MIVTVTPNTCIDKVVEVRGFAVGGTLKGRVLRQHPAGKGINVSRCLAAMGHASAATGFVGRNERLVFARELARHGIADSLVEVDGRTRENITYLDPDARTETHVREEGFTVQPADLERLKAELARLVRPESLVVLAGSVPPGMPATALAELVAACSKLGGRVAVDSNAEPFGHAVNAGPFLIKPNARELEELTGLSVGTPDEAIAAARTLLDRVEIVLASMGAEGAVCATADRCWHARGQVSDVQSTVGCGDAALAGFLAGLEQGAAIPDCLARAIACGGAGARCNIAGELHPHDVDELLPLVNVREI